MRWVDFLDRACRVHPQRVFCSDDRRQVTYAEAQAGSHRIAGALRALGVKNGSKVSVYAPNCCEALECIYGLNRAGAVWVPMNARNPVEENAHVVQSLDVEFVLYHASLADAVTTLRGQVSGNVRFLPIGAAGESTPDSAPGALPHGLGERRAGWDEIASIMPTGGTSGRPKGVMHTHLTWMAQIANLGAALPHDGPPVHLAVAPLTHAAGAISLILTAQGATHVILERFDAERVMQSIERHRVTHLFLPPTALYSLLAHPEVRRGDYSSLRYFIYGAAPSAQAKIEEAISVFGPVMTQGYGQTEAPTACTFLLPRDHQPADEGRRHLLRSCGRPTVLTDIRIVASDGSEAKPMNAGEIEVRGPLVMAGYYNNPEATRQVMHEGWLRTGDIGYMDAEGYLYIVDRSKDMIISGGFNIYPSEVEAVACSLVEVEDCAAIGVPDEKWGEAVKLVVQLKRGHAIDVAVVHRICRERLGGVKAPKSIEIWAELPRSPTGKVLRRSVREHFWRDAGRKI